MNALILAVLVAQVADAPVAPNNPPRLIDENGQITTITGTETLELNTICFTGAKAKIERDGKVACEAERADFRSKDAFWSTPLIIALAVVAAGAGAAGTYGVLKATGNLR